MAIEAPFSKHKKTNLRMYIAACLIFAAIFAYDGYLSKYPWSRRHSFYEKHTKDGQPDDTMIFNQVAPILLVVLAAGLAARLLAVKDRKLLADEDRLIISNKEKIPYQSIQKVDKTYFGSKGHFVITYEGKGGEEIHRRLSNNSYDNLTAVLDELVGKIS